MNTPGKLWTAFRAVLDLEGDVRRLTQKLADVDARERETRERLVYLEGVVAGASAAARGTRQLPRD